MVKVKLVNFGSTSSYIFVCVPADIVVAIILQMQRHFLHWSLCIFMSASWLNAWSISWGTFLK